jgi:hypothetical protein
LERIDDLTEADARALLAELMDAMEQEALNERVG